MSNISSSKESLCNQYIFEILHLAGVVNNAASGNLNNKIISKPSGRANGAKSIDSAIWKNLQ